MDLQHQIDFTHPHNNSESAVMFQQNKQHFSNQCQIVLGALRKGERLTTTTALLKYGIGDLRRRIKDLIDIYGIPVQADYKQGSRFKEYYLKS